MVTYSAYIYKTLGGTVAPVSILRDKEVIARVHFSEPVTLAHAEAEVRGWITRLSLARADYQPTLRVVAMCERQKKPI